MLRINRVLHATNFSDVSRSAMEYSLLLARLLDVRLDVLHVSDTVDEKMERVVTFVSYAQLIDPVLLVAAQIAPLFGARLDVLVQIDGGPRRFGSAQDARGSVYD